jgi:hypothetical protein
MHYAVSLVVDMSEDNTVVDAIAVVEVEPERIVTTPAVVDNRSEVVCSWAAVVVVGIVDAVDLCLVVVALFIPLTT